ncbi:MAG: transcriptional repressor [Oscillospiraceae bacterium]|nr:transcriptional repressor [Oscillospiraceae bacterium]
MAILRYSEQREAIRQNLCARYDHPTAEMIFLDVKKNQPQIGLATVYRNLAQLCEMGAAQKITCDGADHFDATVAPHPHFVCTRCGAVLDFEHLDSALLENLRETAQRGFDGHVQRVLLCYEGICSACKSGDDCDQGEI